MTRIRDIFLTVAAALIILQSLAFGDTGRAIAQTFTDVIVKNTTSNPVPVKSVGTAAVRVYNPLSAPVWVRDANEARQPVTAQVRVNLTANNSSEQVRLYTVPAGKRLVIEYISGQGSVPHTQALIDAGVLAMTSGVFGFHTVNPKTQGIYNNQMYYTLGEATRIYADAGSGVFAYATRTDWTSEGVVLISFSGYLVNFP